MQADVAQIDLHAELVDGPGTSTSVPPLLSLAMTAGPCSGSQLQGKGFHLTVGRTRASKLHVKGDSAVSEKHAALSWDGSSWTLTDLGSSNGTAVNGRAMQPLVDTVALKAGDEILFGLESRALVQLQPRTVGELTVEQLLAAVVEAAAQRVQARGRDNARALLTELSVAKAGLSEQAKMGSTAA